MRRLLLIPLLILLSCSVFAQSREELYNNFEVAISEQDTTATLAIISDWEKLFPNDAELYSLRANHYFQTAIDEGLVISPEEPTDGRQCMVITDSLGVKGYMYSEMLVDSTKLDSAKRSLEEGIILHPNRLDLRLGKVTIHLYVNEYADAIKEVKSALEQSKINNNNWLETLDTPIETDGVSYLRDCIQDYFAQFLETDNLPFAEKLADVCVELYPKEAIFLTDKGTARYYAGDQQGAAEWYLKAHKNSPNDMLIATNLAILYEQQGEIKKAIKYYTIVAKSGDEEFSESAKAALTELKAE